MQQKLIIALEDFPEEGKQLEGELDGALFGIDNDDIQSIGPLHYKLEAQLFGTELVLHGSISAPFRMRCNRCLQTFDYTAELPDLALSYDTAGKLSTDATDDLREELLLALPPYPKCELADRECEINDTLGDFRLDKDTEAGVESAAPSGRSVWDALDQLPKD